MTFYQACLGGELTLQRASDSPMRAQVPAALQSRVLHARLANGQVDLSATDWMHPTRRPSVGNTVGVYLVGASGAELRPAFDRLAVGADKELLDPLQDLPFGTYGHLRDRFGVHWFFWAGRPGA